MTWAAPLSHSHSRRSFLNLHQSRSDLGVNVQHIHLFYHAVNVPGGAEPVDALEVYDKMTR